MAPTAARLYLLLTAALAAGAAEDRPVEQPLRMAAFNIQNLGEAKFSKEHLVDVVKKIILRYDVIFLQEIVTQKEVLMQNLLRNINEMAPVGTTYNITISERLGRGYAKEQYAYMYKVDKLRVLDAHVYPDKEDKFMRPPYIAHFSSPTVRNLTTFVAIGIHTQPKNAVNETSATADVYDYAQQLYNVQDAVIMGDMNAGCSSIRVGDWKDVDLWTREEFTWLIGHDRDTTTYLNSCPYDRFVVAGNKMKDAVILSSVQTFNFQRAYNLTDSQTQEVSDHWPIELQLKGKVSPAAERYLRPEMCLMMQDNRPAMVPSSLLDYKTSMGFSITIVRETILIAEKQAYDIDKLLDTLDKFQRKYPDVVTYEALEATRYKSTFGALNDESSFVGKPYPLYRITITCDLEEKDCTMLICRQTSIN